MLITEIAKVSAPKNKKNAPAAGESGNQRPKRRKDKNGRPGLASGSTKVRCAPVKSSNSFAASARVSLHAPPPKVCALFFMPS